jgi:hypothetical protein
MEAAAAAGRMNRQGGDEGEAQGPACDARLIPRDAPVREQRQLAQQGVAGARRGTARRRQRYAQGPEPHTPPLLGFTRARLVGYAGCFQ